MQENDSFASGSNSSDESDAAQPWEEQNLPNKSKEIPTKTFKLNGPEVAQNQAHFVISDQKLAEK